MFSGLPLFSYWCRLYLQLTQMICSQIDHVDYVSCLLILLLNKCVLMRRKDVLIFMCSVCCYDQKYWFSSVVCVWWDNRILIFLCCVCVGEITGYWFSSVVCVCWWDNQKYWFSSSVDEMTKFWFFFCPGFVVIGWKIRRGQAEGTYQEWHWPAACIQVQQWSDSVRVWPDVMCGVHVWLWSQTTVARVALLSWVPRQVCW